MRKSAWFICFTAAGCLLTCLMLLDARRHSSARPDVPVQRLVQDLGLTDLCLFTEARYTRHLSQADLHAAFQDGPLALEHFPSGSLVNAKELHAAPH